MEVRRRWPPYPQYQYFADGEWEIRLDRQLLDWLVRNRPISSAPFMFEDILEKVRRIIATELATIIDKSDSQTANTFMLREIPQRCFEALKKIPAGSDRSVRQNVAAYYVAMLIWFWNDRLVMYHRDADGLFAKEDPRSSRFSNRTILTYLYHAKNAIDAIPGYENLFLNVANDFKNILQAARMPRAGTIWAIARTIMDAWLGCEFNYWPDPGTKRVYHELHQRIGRARQVISKKSWLNISGQNATTFVIEAIKMGERLFLMAPKLQEGPCYYFLQSIREANQKLKTLGQSKKRQIDERIKTALLWHPRQGVYVRRAAKEMDPTYAGGPFGFDDEQPKKKQRLNAARKTPTKKKTRRRTKRLRCSGNGRV